VKYDLEGDPYRNGVQKTLRRKGIWSRTSKGLQQDKKIPDEGQEKPGTRAVTT
jgi:hypothetical protein